MPDPKPRERGTEEQAAMRMDEAQVNELVQLQANNPQAFYTIMQHPEIAQQFQSALQRSFQSRMRIRDTEEGHAAVQNYVKAERELFRRLHNSPELQERMAQTDPEFMTRFTAFEERVQAESVRRNEPITHLDANDPLLQSGHHRPDPAQTTYAPQYSSVTYGPGQYEETRQPAPLPQPMQAPTPATARRTEAPIAPGQRNVIAIEDVTKREEDREELMRDSNARRAASRRPAGGY